jgi:hypothetical protein
METPKKTNGAKQRLKTLAETTEKQKKALVEQLRRTPIVQLACERTGVGRATYYKWRAQDRIFAKAATRALDAGKFFVNDLAESKLIQLIQNGNITALIFWLKSNHPAYTPMNKVIHEYEIVTNRLTPEEKNIAEQELAKILAQNLRPKITAEGLKAIYEQEEIEDKDTEALRKYEEE